MEFGLFGDASDDHKWYTIGIHRDDASDFSIEKWTVTTFGKSKYFRGDKKNNWGCSEVMRIWYDGYDILWYTVVFLIIFVDIILSNAAVILLEFRYDDGRGDRMVV